MSVDRYKQILSLSSEQQPTATANASDNTTAPIGESTLLNGNTIGILEPNGDKEEEVGTKVSFIDITHIKEEGADRPSVCPTSKRIQAPKQKQQKDKYAEYALVLRRKYTRKPGKSSEPIFDRAILEVNDEVIRKAIRHTLGDYPFVNLSTTPIEIKAPYRELFHYREEIFTYINSSERSLHEKERLQVLTSFMTDNLDSSLREYNKHVPHGNITYDLLWTLYRPNSLIVTRSDNISRCFQVKEYNHGTIRCYFWGYLSGRFGRVLHQISLKPFEGVRKITHLSAVPLNFLPDEKQQRLTESLIKRGQKWQSLCRISHMTYNGQSARGGTLNMD